jgi:C-terminal processing protease CtpA/Prc
VAGLRPGDYILSIDGDKLTSPEDFDEALKAAKPDGQAEVVVWRNGEKSTRKVQFDPQFTSGFRPESDGNDADGESDAWLGVLLADSKEGEKGARIDRIYPGGPAARSGLQSGDILIKVGETEISDADQAAEIIAQAKPNEEIEMTVMRDEEEVKLAVVLADRRRFFPTSQAGGEQQNDFDDELGEHAMMLEQHRRFAEQHERLEDLMHEMLDEIQSLRNEVRELKGKTAAAPE